MSFVASAIVSSSAINVGVDGTTYEESTTAPTNAGTYQYTITIPATAEWEAAEKSGKFTINKYELTVLYEKTHTTKEYDGSKGVQNEDFCPLSIEGGKLYG